MSAAGIERLEQVRADGGFMLQVGVRYGLMGGTAAPDWQEPHRAVRVAFPDRPPHVSIKRMTGCRTSWIRGSRARRCHW